MKQRAMEIQVRKKTLSARDKMPHRYLKRIWNQLLTINSDEPQTSPGELLMQVVWFGGVEFYSHVKAVWRANWKAEQNKKLRT